MWSQQQSPAILPLRIGSVIGATQVNDLHSLERLLQAGANPNEQDPDGRTPLMWAAVHGHQATMQKLLSSKADPAIVGISGETASSISVARGNGHCLALIARASSLQKRSKGTRSATSWVERSATSWVEAADEREHREVEPPMTNELAQHTRDEIRSIQQSERPVAAAVAETSQSTARSTAQ